MLPPARRSINSFIFLSRQQLSHCLFFMVPPHHCPPPTLYSPLCAIITPIVTLMNSRFQIPESRSNSPPQVALNKIRSIGSKWLFWLLKFSDNITVQCSSIYKRTLASSPYLRVRGDEAGSGSVMVWKDNGKKIQILFL